MLKLNRYLIRHSLVRSFSSVKVLKRNSELLSVRKRNGGGRIIGETHVVLQDDNEDDENFEEYGEESEDERIDIDFDTLFDKEMCPKPSVIVAELDKHIIGQDKAKKSVAIALRNRWRARALKKQGTSMEITPSNILMVGPTGCGKTEIARRLAKLSDAPFVKVEATNYTEVGFHGRDVDKIIQDLYEAALQLIREKVSSEMEETVNFKVENALVNALAGPNAAPLTREHFREMIKSNEMEDQLVKIDIENANNILGSLGKSGVVLSQNFADILNLSGIKGKKSEVKSLKVSTARQKLREQFARSVREDMEESQTTLAISLAQERGIVFIDEIDKICSNGIYSPNASSEGVQRDLLPLVEGSSIPIKQGNVSTDNVLFICAGSFHNASVSDLIPELQGRLPIRVELEALTEAELAATLKLEKNSLLEKYKSMLAVEQVIVDVEDKGCIDYMAKVAFDVNKHVENIGVRRLTTIVEKVLEDLSFLIPEVHEALAQLDDSDRSDTEIVSNLVKESLGEEAKHLKISLKDRTPVLTITQEFLENKIGSLMEKVDLEKFIL